MVIKANVEGPPTIHILLELCGIARLVVEIPSTRGKRVGHTDSRLGFSNLRKLHHACSLGTRPIKRDFSQFDLASRLEQLNKIFIRSRPRELKKKNSSWREFTVKQERDDSRCEP